MSKIKILLIVVSAAFLISCVRSSLPEAKAKVVPVNTSEKGEFRISFLYRFNQLGFKTSDTKTAVLMSESELSGKPFYLKDSKSNNTIFQGMLDISGPAWGTFPKTYVIDFSSVSTPGSYYLDVESYKSTTIRIGNDIYRGMVDSLLKFFRVQRCGPTNPILHEPCHLSDCASIVGDLAKGGTDLTGGWHDAGDYTKFLNTTAFTTYLLLFSYEFNKSKLETDLNNNGAPDILEEARVGLDWLLRCNYERNKLVIQVQDTRDQSVGWRLPENDPLKFDRPAFAGMGKNLIGIYSAALAIGSRIWRERFSDNDFSDKLLKAANEIFALRKTAPDLDKTPEGMYQDSKFLGKLALGTIEMYITTKEHSLLDEAAGYAVKAGSDYWWSWGDVNSLAQYRVAKFKPELTYLLESNLIGFTETSAKSSFGEATAYTWGTTHAFLGASLQSILYNDLTKNNTYKRLSDSQIDYVLGKNPWGVSFIYGIGSRFTKHFHSQVAYFNGGYLPGGVAAGPAPAELLSQFKIDRKNFVYNKFNSSEILYYDDRNDYITNEPTIVTNATAVFVFSNK